MSIFRKRDKKSYEEDTLIATCDCIGGDIELNHALVFTLYRENYGPELYAHVHLKMLGRSFWQRLVAGIKYIFGRDCRWGHYGEWILKKEDAKEIRGMFNKYLKMLDAVERAKEEGKTE